jgi:hypothetical protein
MSDLVNGKTLVLKKSESIYLGFFIKQKKFYKYFSVQSVESWYSKLVELNKNIDSSGEIKKAFKEKGITL